MTSHNKPYSQLNKFDLSTKNIYPVASTDDPLDENDEALERRREERRKRKQEKRRNQFEIIEEGDPDLLLQEPKKVKRPKNKKLTPDDLWYDDSLDEELDGVDDDDDWQDQWDS